MGVFLKSLKIRNQIRDCGGICLRVGLSGVTKKRKTLKRADMRPLFGFCKDVLVVVMWWGVGDLEGRNL